MFGLKRDSRLLLQAVLLCGGMALANAAMALQIGPGFHLSSARGQPFAGELPLKDVGSLQPGDISVELGNEADFTSLGVVRANFLDSFKFAVVVDPKGSYIKITSDIPIDVSNVDLVLRITWPGSSQVLAEMVPIPH